MLLFMCLCLQCFFVYVYVYDVVTYVFSVVMFSVDVVVVVFWCFSGTPYEPSPPPHMLRPGRCEATVRISELTNDTNNEYEYNTNT